MNAKERALQFLNKAKEPDNLIRHFYDEKGKLISYIIGASVAQQIMELRMRNDNRFDDIESILVLGRFGENKLDLLIRSFEEEYLKRQAKLKLLQANSKLVQKQKMLDRNVILLFKRMFAQANSETLKSSYLHLSCKRDEAFQLKSKLIARQEIYNPIVYVKSDLPVRDRIFTCSFLNANKQFQLRVRLKLSI